MAEQPVFKPKQDSVKIRGYSQNIRGLANPEDVSEVVAALVFDQCDPMITRAPNIKTHGTVRLDRQPNTSDGDANFQVQVNGDVLQRAGHANARGTTVAQVLVSPAIFSAARNFAHQGVRKHLENVVRAALIQSFKSYGMQYIIVAG